MYNHTRMIIHESIFFYTYIYIYIYIYGSKLQGSNFKNGLKVKQLAKQPPTLKTLLQKILFEL